MTDDEKRDVLSNLLQIYAKAVDLESLLWLRGESKDASEVEKRADKIRDRVDALRNDLWASWTGQANTIRKQLAQSQQDVSDVITAIKQKIATANDVVKAIGYLDAVIAVAAGILV